MSEFKDLIESKVYIEACVFDKMAMLKDLKHYSMESGCDANLEFYKLFEGAKQENAELRQFVSQSVDFNIHLEKVNALKKENREMLENILRHDPVVTGLVEALKFYARHSSSVLMTKDMQPENGRIAKQALDKYKEEVGE